MEIEPFERFVCFKGFCMSWRRDVVGSGEGEV